MLLLLLALFLAGPLSMAAVIYRNEYRDSWPPSRLLAAPRARLVAISARATRSPRVLADPNTEARRSGSWG